MATQASSSVLPKACENCRVRKVRCDRNQPCSNCQTSAIDCRPPVKSVEHRPRVLLSANYEKSIEHIHDRLNGIERALNSLSVNQNARTPLSDPPSASNVPPSAPGAVSTTPIAFKGGSSFSNQTVQASRIAELTAAQGNQTSEIADALQSLRSIVETNGLASVGHDYRFQKTTPKPLPEMQMLPAAFVISLLRHSKAHPSAFFLSFAIRDHYQLEKLCRRIYFPTEPVTLGALTTMYGLLYLLLVEYILGDHPMKQEYDLDAYLKTCEDNFHIGIETYEILAYPTHENLQALMLGFVKAQADAQPLLSWMLVSTAARHAQSLGYHRKASYKFDTLQEAEDKRQVFWTIYQFEKNLSLSLGRPTTLPDYDIDVEYFALSTNPSIRPWDTACLLFTDLSRIQGYIYERLYTSSALLKTASERALIIAGLSDDLETWYKRWGQLDSGKAYEEKFFLITFGPTDVIYYSILTTLHRASSISASATEITFACYDGARRSLQSHLQHFPQFQTEGLHMMSIYVSWILLYSSFTPLIVVFMHALASSSTEDVKLLQDVCDTLEHMKGLSKEAERLYETSKAFSRIAEAYVSSQQSFIGIYNPQEDAVVIPRDPQQSFAQPQPNFFPEMFAQAESANFNTSDVDGVSTFFGNWLGGNQPVMNILNMDFSENM